MCKGFMRSSRCCPSSCETSQGTILSSIMSSQQTTHATQSCLAFPRSSYICSEIIFELPGGDMCPVQYYIVSHFKAVIPSQKDHRDSNSEYFTIYFCRVNGLRGSVYWPSAAGWFAAHSSLCPHFRHRARSMKLRAAIDAPPALARPNDINGMHPRGLSDNSANCGLLPAEIIVLDYVYELDPSCVLHG